MSDLTTLNALHLFPQKAKLQNFINHTVTLLQDFQNYTVTLLQKNSNYTVTLLQDFQNYTVTLLQKNQIIPLLYYKKVVFLQGKQRNII